MLGSKEQLKNFSFIIVLNLWALWFSAVIFLRFYINDEDGGRILIPYGQYIFFSLVLISLYLLRAFAKKSFQERDNFWFFSLILLLFIFILSSAVFGVTPFFGSKLTFIIFITSVPFILLGMKSTDSPSQFVMPFVIMALFCALGTIILEQSGPLTFNSIVFENHMHTLFRWSFLFSEANGLGKIIVVGFAIALYYFSIKHSIALKLLLGLIVLPLFAFILYKTNGRGNTVWMLFTLLCYGSLLLRFMWLKSKDKMRLIKYVITILIFITLMSALVVYCYFDQLHQYFRLHKSDVTSGRMQVWLVYMAEFKEHPWFGFGTGGASIITQDLSVKFPLNAYIGTLGEYGLLSFIVLFILWIGAIVKAFQGAFQKKVMDIDAHYCFLILVLLSGLMIVQIGTWSILKLVPLNYLFFFLIAAAWRIRLENKIA